MKFHEAVMKRDERLHLQTSLLCNNRCVFCMETGHRGGMLKAARAIVGYDHLNEKWLVRKLGGGEKLGVPLLFTGGEPTINPNLEALVKLARRRGFRRICLQTNGRMLCYRDFCLLLVKAGITEFSFSIHGSVRTVHERMTRVPGSFSQAKAGLENLLDIRRELPFLRINTTTTVTRINLSDMEPLLEWLLSDCGIDPIILNPLSYKGNAVRHFKHLAVSFSEMIKVFQRALETIARKGMKGLERIRWTDIPPCVMRNLERHAGYFEQVFIAGTDNALRALGPKQIYESRKRRACARCRFSDACTGISPVYLERYGWDEFIPVK